MNSIIKFVGVAALAIALLAIVGWVQQRGAGSNQAKTAGAYSGTLVVAEKHFDFGSISMKNGTVSRRFTLSNAGSEPVVITKVYTSCMCTSATVSVQDTVDGPFGMPGHGRVPSISRQILPGQSADVAVTFDPAAHGPAGVGTVNRTVFVETDSDSTVELTFTATVTP